MILCDTGVLVTIVDRRQPQHDAYRQAITRYGSPLLTTWACLTEAMYLTHRLGGWTMQQQLGQLLLKGGLTVHAIDSAQQIVRLLALMEQYRDRPMDIADATLVLTAEETGYRQILTLDSDFLFYRIHNRESFDVMSVEE
ncbi:MAG: type II toxin-antitoxin system VapC family toxin [Spirulinaceae cyanobacterium]